MTKKSQIARKTNALQQLAASLTTPASSAADKKAAREAERAKRFPTAAKQEAEAKSAGPVKKNEAKGKTTRAATPKAPKVVAAKPVQPPFVPRVAKPGDKIFAISDVHNARPTGGAALFAHTHAALTMIGLFDAKRPAQPVSIATSVMGSTAVKYHMAQGNMEAVSGGMLRLSERGFDKFAKRSVDTGLANEFMALFFTGKVGKTGINPNYVMQLR